VVESEDALYIDAGLSQHLNLRARADRRSSPRARGQITEERCQGERGARERDMVRDRAAHAQHVRRGRVNLFCLIVVSCRERHQSVSRSESERESEQSCRRTLQMMSLGGDGDDDEPGIRAAIGFSCVRHSDVRRSPGLLFVGSRRGGIPLAGRARGQ